LERERIGEGAARPREFFAREAGGAPADVQLYGIRVECEALPKDVDGFIVLAFVVQLVRAFVELVRAPERIVHLAALPWGRMSNYKNQPQAEQEVGSRCD